MKIQNLLIAILFTFLIYSCDNSVGPYGVNYHNKILFTSSRSGTQQLYMMNPDATDIEQITSGQYSHSGGRWSPDAKQIIAGTDENWTTACYSHMVLMYSDGTNRRLLSCGAQMSWSPDGKRIAFAYMPSGELGDITTYIYIINVDGTNTVKLTNNLGVTDNTPSWSPDGTSIAFSSNRDYLTSKFNSEIYLMDVYGNNQTRLTNTITSAGSPQWSPDGTTIAFVADGICLINKDGTNYRQIINDEAGICVYRLPQWSPDGKQLVITWISSDGNAIKKIFIINNDGTGLKTILSDSTAVVSDWSK